MKLNPARGSVLLVSLWALGFFTSVTVAQATRVALQVRWVGREHERLRADEMARTALSYALWQLEIDPSRTRDDLNEDWAHPEKWIPQFQPQQDSWQLKIADAQGKISLNDARQEDLERIPELKEVAEKIVEKRGERPFVYLEELVARVGISPEKIATLRTKIRTQGTKPLNVYTVTPEALQLVGLSEELARKICEFVQSNNKEDEPPLFDVAGNISPVLSDRLQFNAQEAAAVSALVADQWLDVKSSCFDVEAVAVTSPHAVKRTVRALVLRTDPGTPIKVVEWNER